MRTISAEDFKNQYGEEQYNLANHITSASQAEPGLFSRIGQDIQSAGEQVRAQAVGEGEYGGQSPLRRATGMVSTAFSAIPQVASEFLPKVGREAIGAIGSGMESAVNYLGQKLGDVQAVHNFVINNPEAAKKLIDSLGIVQNVGQTAGVIAGTAEAANLANKGAGAIASGVQKTGEAISEGASSLVKTGKQIVGGVSKGDRVSELLNPELKGKALEKAIKTTKVSEGQGLFGKRDITGTIPNFEEMKSAVSEIPGIKEAKTSLEANNLVGNYNKTVHADLMNRLSQEKAITNPSIIKNRMNAVRTTLNETPTMVGDAAAAGEKIINKFQSLVEENGYTGEGVMKARIALDKWAGAGKKFSNTAADNGATAALRAVRDAANEMAAELSPNTETQALLRKQTMLHRAQDILASKAAKEGSTKVQQFVKKHPIITKAAKIGTAGTIAGEAAGLVK